ncbi:hypothetical protein PG990_004128 [Apiospora arundinis]
MFEYLKKLKPSPPETARLGDYIRKAYTKDPSIKPFPDNRIIYYIGTFNPPHQGHIALLDHVYRHSRDPDSFNAVAVIVMAHGESWVRRKVRGDAKPLQLTFDQRRRLLEDGLDNSAQTTDNMRSWLWVMPRDVNGWWAFQSKLAAACTKDGFALEFHELLGPDYVKASGPQCYAWNGVVTSNICRPADFDAGRRRSTDPAGRVDGADAENEEDEAWMCYKQQKEGREEQQYSIRYIRCKQPDLDPDMSSSKLRRIIAESAPEELAENLRGLAPNPELLIQVMQENTKE